MRALFTACAALALMAGTASAQGEPGAQQSADAVYLEAGILIDDRENQVLYAREGVRMQAGQRVLLADEIEYRPATGRVIARGNVRLFDGPGPAQIAEEIELDDEMSEGVALGFATVLENQGKAAAAVAVRRANGTVELTDGYYTACDLCEDGSGEPTWRLRAGRVVRDLDDQMIYYRDVRLEVLGQPVLYSPVFAHADPSTPRRSGFLIPRIDISNRLGFSYTQPYLWVISPYQDLVVAPRLMTEVNPVLELDWRKRFYSGQIALEGSLTYEREFIDPDQIDDLPASDPREFDENGFYGDDKFQWHVFSEGRFAISEEWSWGFGVQATAEDLYLRRYDFNETPDLGSGLYEVENRFLASQAYVQGRGERYYADLATIKITSLLENFNDDRIPIVTPVGRFLAELPFPAWAGQLETDLSVAALTREDGDDYIRSSAAASWSRVAILPFGVRAEPYATGRFDAYSITQTDRFGVETGSSNFTRTLGAAGLDVSWPFARVAPWGDVVVAPRAHIVTASEVETEDTPPNEDSQVVDLDSISLFARNRAGGFDIWEEGARADLGVTTTLDTVAPLIPDIEVFAGRSLRLDDDPVFGPATGLGSEESDWVAEFSIDVGYFDIASRNRLDAEDGDLRRSDVVLGVDVGRFTADVDYTRIRPDAPGGRSADDITVSASLQLTERWSLVGSAKHDIEDDITRTALAALVYRDECTDFRIVFESQNYDIGRLEDSQSIGIQVTLFTLGSLQDE